MGTAVWGKGSRGRAYSQQRFVNVGLEGLKKVLEVHSISGSMGMAGWAEECTLTSRDRSSRTRSGWVKTCRDAGEL